MCSGVRRPLRTSTTCGPGGSDRRTSGGVLPLRSPSTNTSPARLDVQLDHGRPVRRLVALARLAAGQAGGQQQRQAGRAEQAAAHAARRLLAAGSKT